MPDKIRIDFENTRTSYFTYQEEKFILSATEYVYLYDGTTKMRAKSRELTFNIVGDITEVTRYSQYKDNISTVQTYIFNSKVQDVEYVPVSHSVQCINCVGKILHFEYKDIKYDSGTQDITSPFSFGNNMKIEWQDGAYLSKVYTYKTASPKIWIRYKVKSNDEVYKVRMFDPEIELADGSKLIGAYQVKELCDPVFKSWFDEIYHYKECTSKCKVEIFPNGSKCLETNFPCLDYIEKVEHKNVQVDCIPNGKMEVNGNIQEDKSCFWKINGNQICCYSYKEGGRYAITWRNDSSVDRKCKDLTTNKEVIIKNGIKVS